jgi:cytidylate kinase
MLIGISGPSCSGKTTLAREIGRILDAPVLHLDRHFLDEAERPVVEGHPSFERPHQYDGAALLRDARQALCDHAAVVVEGFLLFSYPGFELECAQMVHLDVPHEVLAERRLARAIAKDAASDVKGGRKKTADAGWQAHGRSEWERWGAFQADIAGMQVVRSRDHGGAWPSTPEAIAQAVVDSWWEPAQQAA